MLIYKKLFQIRINQNFYTNLIKIYSLYKKFCKKMYKKIINHILLNKKYLKINWKSYHLYYKF